MTAPTSLETGWVNDVCEWVGRELPGPEAAGSFSSRPYTIDLPLHRPILGLGDLAQALGWQSWEDPWVPAQAPTSGSDLGARMGPVPSLPWFFLCPRDNMVGLLALPGKLFWRPLPFPRARGPQIVSTEPGPPSSVVSARPRPDGDCEPPKQLWPCHAAHSPWAGSPPPPCHQAV